MALEEILQVHADLLNGAATEAKAAAELRREAERENARNAVEQAELTAEQAELAKLRDQVQRDLPWMGTGLAHAGPSQCREVGANCQKHLRDVLDKQAERLERAKATADKEAQTLSEARALNETSTKAYRAELAGLGALAEVAAMVRKPGMVAGRVPRKKRAGPRGTGHHERQPAFGGCLSRHVKLWAGCAARGLGWPAIPDR